MKFETNQGSPHEIRHVPCQSRTWFVHWRQIDVRANVIVLISCNGSKMFRKAWNCERYYEHASRYPLESIASGFLAVDEQVVMKQRANQKSNSESKQFMIQRRLYVFTLFPILVSTYDDRDWSRFNRTNCMWQNIYFLKYHMETRLINRRAVQLTARWTRLMNRMALNSMN